MMWYSFIEFAGDGEVIEQIISLQTNDNGERSPERSVLDGMIDSCSSSKIREWEQVRRLFQVDFQMGKKHPEEVRNIAEVFCLNMARLKLMNKWSHCPLHPVWKTFQYKSSMLSSIPLQLWAEVWRIALLGMVERLRNEHKNFRYFQSTCSKIRVFTTLY